MRRSTSLKTCLPTTILLSGLFGCASNDTTDTAEQPRDTLAEAPALAMLPDDASAVSPLGVGDRAPAATLRDLDGRNVNLADRYRAQPTVLVFYRGGWCPYCTRHLAELALVEDDLRELGYRIIAVSPDRPEKLRDSLDDTELGYELLSDSRVVLASAFGVAFRLDDGTVRQYSGFGIDLTDASGESHQVLPVPAVFIIDQGGIIRYTHHDANYRERLSGSELLEAARTAREDR